MISSFIIALSKNLLITLFKEHNIRKLVYQLHTELYCGVPEFAGKHYSRHD